MSQMIKMSSLYLSVSMHYFFNTLKQPGYKTLDTRLRSEILAEKTSSAANLAARGRSQTTFTRGGG